ncbi:PASTA domain-containing protein [Microlunatus elymi]
MSKQRAEQVASKSGLDVNFSQSYSETVPKGTVINTSPRPGAKILRGGEMTVVLSRGPERHPMPKVTGLSKDAAESLLQKGKLAVGSVSDKFSESVDKGLVLSSSAEPGDRLKAGTKINLVISAGRKPIKITNYTGQNAEQSATALKDAGFKVKITSEHSATVPAGAVISQSPADGTGHLKDRIKLVSSLGPVMVTVPQVRSMGVEAAKKTLQDKGFKVRTTTSTILNLGLGYVASSDPGAGKSVPKGSTITLTLV